MNGLFVKSLKCQQDGQMVDLWTAELTLSSATEKVTGDFATKLLMMILVLFLLWIFKKTLLTLKIQKVKKYRTLTTLWRKFNFLKSSKKTTLQVFLWFLQLILIMSFLSPFFFFPKNCKLSSFFLKTQRKFPWTIYQKKWNKECLIDENDFKGFEVVLKLFSRFWKKCHARKKKLLSCIHFLLSCD